jgi:hypothetical protein
MQVKLSQVFTHAILVSIIAVSVAHAQELSPEDVQDFDEATGLGCIAKDPVTGSADFYYACRSRTSADQAWNAALYRSKMACGGDKFSLYFNVSPSLPLENGIHGAQVEVGCGGTP